jgi:hypothetical protein
MLAGRYALLLSWKRKFPRAEPSARTKEAFASQNSLIRAIEVAASPALRQPLYSDALFQTLPPQVHNVKFKPARIADHDALIGQIIGGAVMPICADKALHVPTIWGFFLWCFELSTE